MKVTYIIEMVARAAQSGLDPSYVRLSSSRLNALLDTAPTKRSPEESPQDRSDLHPARAKFPPRDPEDRMIDVQNIFETRDKMFDKTVADSFPASDPPSTLPDPTEDSFRPSSE